MGRRQDVDIPLIGIAAGRQSDIEAVDGIPKPDRSLQQVLSESGIGAASLQMSLTVGIEDAGVAAPVDQVLGCRQMFDPAVGVAA